LTGLLLGAAAKPTGRCGTKERPRRRMLLYARLARYRGRGRCRPVWPDLSPSVTPKRVFVTRSLQEALILGDRVVVLGRAPARVKDVVEVSGVTDPDSEWFVCSRRQLRKLLTDEIDGGRSL
jgi:hypothetical protein